MRSRQIISRLTVTALVASAAGARGQAVPASPIAIVQSGTLSFSGHATVGDFTGSTTTITGAVTGQLSDAGGWVEAPVATLVTGNDHRDRDLRASMEVDKYPTMRFTLARTAYDPATSATPIVLHGALTIHGVTRDVDLPATAERIKDTIHITAGFPLDLRDYHIGGLTKMLGILRMDPHIEVHVDLRFLATSSVNPEQ
jgi:polyisoprenoid-binding protein YceI